MLLFYINFVKFKIDWFLKNKNGILLRPTHAFCSPSVESRFACIDPLQRNRGSPCAWLKERLGSLASPSWYAPCQPYASAQIVEQEDSKKLGNARRFSACALLGIGTRYILPKQPDRTRWCGNSAFSVAGKRGTLQHHQSYMHTDAAPKTFRSSALTIFIMHEWFFFDIYM